MTTRGAISKQYVAALVVVSLAAAAVVGFVVLRSSGVGHASTTNPAGSSGMSEPAPTACVEPTVPPNGWDTVQPPSACGEQTSNPADQSTIGSPKDDPRDLSQDFETGFVDDSEAPAPGVEFESTGYWNEWFGGAPVTVYAGNAGFNDPKTGAVLVQVMNNRGNLVDGYTLTAGGSGALTVTDVSDDGQTVTLSSSTGSEYELDLAERMLQAK